MIIGGRTLARAWALLVVAACGTTSGSARPELPQPRVLTPAADLEAALADIVPSALREDVEALADDALRGRDTPSAGLDAAAAHIEARLQHAGLKPWRQDACRKATNVLGSIEGSDPSEVVLVTAHYDHLGETHGDADDTVYNGANDNASGVAAVIAIAEAFSRLPPPRRSIGFVAFCGEEKGMKGSKHFVRKPAWPLPSTVAVANLEMLGRPAPEDPPTVWITGHTLSTMPDAFDTGAHFVDATTIGPTEAHAFNRSDNLPFADAGVVAHTFASGRLDDYYHSVADEADSLDYERMAVIVAALARGVHRLADEPTRPAWTKAGNAAGYSASAE